MAWVFQLLGIRVCREEHGLLGVEGRWRSTQSQGKKRKKNNIRTCTKTQVAHCVVHVQSTCGQAVCGGGLASSTQRNLAECNVENRAALRDRH